MYPFVPFFKNLKLFPPTTAMSVTKRRKKFEFYRGKYRAFLAPNRRDRHSSTLAPGTAASFYGDAPRRSDLVASMDTACPWLPCSAGLVCRAGRHSGLPWLGRPALLPYALPIGTAHGLPVCPMPFLPYAGPPCLIGNKARHSPACRHRHSLPCVRMRVCA